MNYLARNPSARRKFLTYLDLRNRLLARRLESSQKERAYSAAAEKLKRWIDYPRLVTQWAIAILVLGALAIVAFMIVDACREKGIRIEALSVPRELADSGLTGQAVAKLIITKLEELDNASSSVRPADTYSNNWGGDIKIDLPETGISINELSHFMHDMLGHALRIGGEVTRTHIGVKVVIRTETDAVEAEGPETDVSKVVSEASERFYAWRQPYRYGRLLALRGDLENSNRVYQEMLESDDSSDQAWGRAGLADNAPSAMEQIEAEKRVLELYPKFLLSRTRVAELEMLIGHEAKALISARRVVEDKDQLSRADITPDGRAILLARAFSVRDLELADFPALEKDAAHAEHIDKRYRAHYELQRALALIRTHDLRTASEILETLPVMNTATVGGIQRSELKALLAAENEDWQLASTVAEWSVATVLVDANRMLCRSHLVPLLAESYARIGRIDVAESVLKEIPSDVYDGWRMRGRVAMLRRDFESAAKYFDEAIRQAPENARAYNDYGEMLAAAGNYKGAMIKFQTATALAPHWADPLKGLGDVGAILGDPKRAISRYEQALVFAPNWRQLKEARSKVAQTDR